ncbi:MAG: transcriptional regulator, partial [Fibrobacteria bacterium]|nr:transcriptional regulator [Fibrobacteria bacterium]
LNRIIHEKARLGILTSLLARPDGLLFNDIKSLCTLTDGNLSRHIKALEAEGLVEIWKRFKHNRPQTLCRMTNTGRERFLEYIRELENVIKDASATAQNENTLEGGKNDLPGLSLA